MKPSSRRKRDVYSRFWSRPSRTIVVLFGLLGTVISGILDQKGIPWKYSEVVFGTLLLLWLLLSGFRPEWRRARYWIAMAVTTALHLWLWLFLVSRIDRFGFALMFVLVIVELTVAGSVIAKLIPEDEKAMLEHIQRW